MFSDVWPMRGPSIPSAWKELNGMTLPLSGNEITMWLAGGFLLDEYEVLE